MKKKVFSLMMMLVLAFMGIARADELTVNDGTTTNGYVPVYGFYADAYLKCEFVQPAADLAAMNGGDINGMTFYASQESVSWGAANFQVFLTEVADASISAFAGPGTVVYEGALSISGGLMNVAFTTPYHYNGGNLLVGVYNTVIGSYVSCSWYGVSTTDASVQGYSYTSLESISPSQRNFLPKVTFDYTAGGGGGTGEQLFALQDGVEVSTVNVGPRPNGCWMEPFTFQLRNDGPAITVTDIDFTPTDYFTVVAPELPVQMASNEEIDVQLTTGNSNVSAWQMVAIYGTGRTASVWDIVAEPYDPAIPDVVEMAYDFGTINNGFSYTGVPSQITPTVLHNDYTLPFPEIPEGNDAVYKFTVATDMILNANVDETALNGKVALYTEDFNGEAGPMADNNYTGIQVGAGGAAGGAFQAMIGDETSTSTSTYFPFHTLWNYSLAENLYLASELSEAGVTTAPMTSLSWYVSSMSCTTPQNNISIYMGNVSDTELTSTSHSIAGMTLVYTGSNILPTAGQWNEFVFNQGNFAWDGQSNVVILCVRNNGTYQGSISWQTHNPGFTAMCYHYSDTNGGYDVTVPNTGMYTSATNRANIILKGGNRENTRDVITQGFEDGLGDWTMVDCHASTGVSTSASAIHTGSNGFAFHWTTTPPQYLISPLLNGESGVDLSFFYEQNSTYYDETFQVGYSTTSNSASAFTFGPEITATNSWAEYTNSFPAGTKYIAIKCTSNDQYYLYIDDITITTAGGGVTPPPTPGLAGMSAGPVITNLPIAPGTYYLVASAQQADYTVNINIDNMPCPAIDAEGFAFNPTPADDENEVEPASVTLRWNVPMYATGYRVIFGTTYYPDPNHPQTVMYPEDGSFTDHVLANSFTVRNLFNNTNYFWRVEFNNDACPQGVSSPVWGFTTHLNIPQNLTAVDYTVFDDEQIVLNWTSVVDRTFRRYFVYRDGVKVGETQANNIGNATYTDGPLAYNMGGYTYYVTAVYDEGESAPSDPVTVKVSGYGDVNGHVYEQDGTTGIAGATVTMVGLDEFNVSHTYNFTTNAQGYYSGHIYAGTYNGQAAKDGYQTITEPVQGNPIAMVYNTVTSPIDYMLDENFDPVCAVIAEYYPDSLDPNSPYVKVYWGCGLPGSEIVEPFETGDFSLFDWQLDPTYPWVIDSQHAYEGQYCMKSGNQQVLSSSSTMEVTVNIPSDGIMSFFGKISCESSWDYGYFYIDGVQRGSYTGESNWSEKVFDITAGDHTFTWKYEEDFMISSGDDCFYVDYITFYKQPAPPVPGMTYDFEDHTMQGWTSIDADGDGYGWRIGSEVMSGVNGHNGSSDFVFSQSYDNSYGVLYPDNYLVSPQVELGGLLTFYACAQDANYAAEHFGVAVSTTNTNPSSFNMVQEWTMSAKSAPVGRPVKNSRSGRDQGNWYEYTVDLSAYSGNGYVAIRHFNCSDMFYLDVDDITIGEPGKSIAAPTRSLDHYRVYRTDCYNDGPYTTENTMLLASVWAPDTVYIDVEWADLAPGIYKWGVGTVYSNNRGEQIEGPISWTAPMAVNNNTRDMVTCDFESGLPAGWTVIDGNNDGLTWTLTSAIPTTWTYYSSLTLDWYHGGSNAICSGSYINGYGAVTPDEYLVSPQVTLGAGSSIDFWVAATDESYPADHFGVFVSDNGTSNWTSVQEWTLTAKKSGETGGRASRDGGGLRIGTWYNYNVDLSAYAGQKYIAFRHFNCYDQYIMCLDDITINTSGSTPPTPPTPPTPGQGGTQVVTFEDGQLPAGWVNDASYPWTVGSPAYAGYNGTYCMMSGNSGISSSTSAMEATVTFVENGSVSFLGGCWGEGTSTIWDKCQFFIDGNEQFSYGALQTWDTYSFNVTAGTHTFRWSYTKDGSVNPTGDAFFVDDITFNGVAGGAGGGLQLPRESEIVWSNCLDKDMWLAPADVNVLLNSADSPEGTVVTFTNYNPVEQQNYPIAPITLDESGFYAFDSFRRGAYRVTVEKEGYEPISDSINFIDYPNNLLTEMHLRYVMTEILYGVGDVYVSRTGWAMWDEANVPGGGGGGGGQSGATTFSEDFENGFANWTLVDADGDGLNWYHSSQSMTYACYDYTGWGHNESNGFAVSSSYTDCTYDSFDPNNFLITNQKYSITSSSMLNFWADYGNDSYPDHFGVAVATVDNPTPADFTIVWEGNAKNGNAGKSQVRHNDDRYFNWRSHSIDLSAYAGQNVYIAFRHFNSYDQYEIYIDDVELTAGAKSDDRHFEYYKVMCTSIDGVPIYNHNTVYPFCQLTTVDPNSGLPMLLEGEHYLCKVAAMYSTGMSAWSEPVEWVYEPCDHWGPVDEVAVNTTNQGNHIEWVFEHGYNPYDPGTGPVPPAPGQGDWYYYDNGVNVDAIGTGGGNFWWAVMFPAGSYQGNMVTKVSAYDYMAMSGNVTIYVGGSSAPATAAGQTNVTFTGSEQFVEFEFADPVTIDPTQNVWVVFYNGSGATYPAAVCDNTGDANGRWVSLDGAAWDDLAGFGLDYTFMVRAYIASGAKGNVKEVKVYEPQGNGGTLAISGNGPRVRTVTENVSFAMLNESTLEFNIADIANYDARVYFLYNLVNDSRFTVVNGEENGTFIVSTDDNISMKESFADFIEMTMSNFGRMNKYQAADAAREYKNVLPMTFVNSMMMDIYAKSRDNSHCADAYPFCTDEGMYEFPAGVNAGSGETGPDYDCLYTTPNPAWYYMKMSDPGDMDIYMYSTPSVDIDFCCWGPFADPISPCPNGLTSDKVVSCSYSAAPTENCLIPSTAQTGEYYILVITNYSNQACNINFSKVGGSGSTDCTIIPPAIVDIIGFLITQDGEYLAFVGPEVREYTDIDEYGDHEYCVRPIYPGEMVLPDHNYGWSMGCPVCANPGGGFTCEPGAPIHVENLYESDQIRVWWGEEPQPPMEEWIYYDNGVYEDAIGTGGSTVYWAAMFPAASLAPYAGTNLTKVAMYEDPSLNTDVVTVYVYLGGTSAPANLVSTQTFNPTGAEGFHEVTLNTPVGVDGTQNLWIAFSEYGTYPATACASTGDPNGRWISLDNVTWEDVAGYGLDYTWMIRGFLTNQAKGMAENIVLEPVKPATVETSNMTLGRYGRVESTTADLSFMNRSSIVKYNVYRSTDNVNYALIGEVAEAGQTLYEYFDSPAPGTYYYQVKAVYDNGCESTPALAFDDPTHDYVIGICDGISENSDNVALYPNPTSGNVTIEANGMSRITVVSVLGQVVFDTELNADTYTLNMAQFNAGLYMVRVYTEEGVTVKRVTVMQ